MKCICGEPFKRGDFSLEGHEPVRRYRPGSWGTAARAKRARRCDKAARRREEQKQGMSRMEANQRRRLEHERVITEINESVAQIEARIT